MSDPRETQERPWAPKDADGRPRETARAHDRTMGNPWPPTAANQSPRKAHGRMGIHVKPQMPTGDPWTSIGDSWEPVDVRGRLMGDPQTPVDAHDRLVGAPWETYGRLLDAHGRRMGAHECTLDTHDRPIGAHENPP